MNPVSDNEHYAAAAFSRQSDVFDELYGDDDIISYKRERVREHILKYLKSDASILELNSGTGEDALFFAERNFRVHATDISEGMQHALEQKVSTHNMEEYISNEVCSYTRLSQLKNKGPYDLIFSNFAGLNCTGELDNVLQSFSGLLKPGGMVTLVILPKFCLWEMLLICKGRFKTAFRRLFAGKGRCARVEGLYFRCWYYNPSFIKRTLKKEFDVLNLEGLCTIVPPSYMEGFAAKYPVAFRKLIHLENKLKGVWPWKYIGDYYIISFQKKD